MGVVRVPIMTKGDQMNRIRAVSAVAAAVMLTGATASCSTSASGAGGDGASGQGTTLTYWATNQAADVSVDAKILTPELAKFTAQTGIKVDLQVIPWATLSAKLLAASVSGQGPDVANCGNTNIASIGATGAFITFDSQTLDAIGGQNKFIPTVFGSTGNPPTSVPLYAQAYGLFYNKQMFADAGLTPPTNWQDLVADAKKLTVPSKAQYGMALDGNSNQGQHMAFIFGHQNGSGPFGPAGESTFTNDGMVAGVKQYLDLMSSGVVNPSDAQYTSDAQVLGDFANGKAAMVMTQTGGIATLNSLGMNPNSYGMVRIPAPSPLPTGGNDISSFVAGSNITVFKSTKHRDDALKLVQFMTSKSEQTVLDKEYGVLPVLKDSDSNFLGDQTDKAKAFMDILNNNALPFPTTANVNGMQTNVGAAVNGLLGQVATGKTVTSADIKAALQAAQDKTSAVTK